MRIWIVALLAAAAAPAAELQLNIVDAGGAPLAARVHVQDAAGKDHVPQGAVVVPIGADEWFACRGKVRLEVPPGAVKIHIERGPEYLPFRETVSMTGNTERRITLRRWTDLRAQGFSSGENHLHIAADVLGAMLAAEDLDFGNSLHWWNDRRLPLPPDARAIMDLTFAGHSAPTSVFDAEVENSWGAVYLNALKKPMPIEWNRRRSNLPYVRLAREQGALISYQGGYSREVFLDALLGYVDVVNVCNNNFHRFKYQPRTQYSNMLDAEGLPVYPNTPEGMMRLNTDTYYRLLNCGLRLAAGAESATGAKTTPAGYNRAYVRAGAKPTLPEFLSAWRKGRNFVTNGPVVLLTADGTREPGDTIALPASGGTVRLTVKAASGQPLRSLEIIVNGRVAARAAIPQDAKEAALNFTASVRQGSWIAARATAEDTLLSDEELQRFRKSGKNLGGEAPCRLRFGHTSPIYVTVGGAGARVPESIAEARRILDAFETYARKTAVPEYLQEILDALPQARRALAEETALRR